MWKTTLKLTKMVCEHSQNEAFQKILLNKIEKLKKQNEKLREEGQKAQTELYFEKKKTEKLKAEISRVQKERNYLGDYQGGATSEEED